MAAGYDGSIRIDTRINSDGFNAGIKGISNSLRGLATAVGIAFGIGAVINFGKSAVQAASDMSSALIGLQSILNGQGKSFASAQTFIDKYISDGLVPATNAINAYKNLSLSGFTSTQIEDMLTRIKDAAAFGKQGALSMGQAIQSATEGIKNENSILVDNAGITKNLSVMWKEYAASIGKTAESLTQAEKNQATFNGIMQETRFQVGDAGKLSQTYAGKVAALGASFEMFKVSVGNAIIPIISAIIPYIKIALDWLTALFTTFAAFISVFFGVDIGGAIGGYASDTEALAAGSNAAADGQGELAKETTKAGKAAKGALAAFDELNVLQKAEPKQATGGKGGAAPAIKIPNTGISDELKKQIAAIKAQVDAFKKALLELFAPAIAAFERLKQALAPLGETIWAGLKWAWDNILVPMGKWTISELLPKFLDLLAAGARVLTEALKSLGPLGQWLLDNFLKPLAAWTGQAILDMLQWLIDRLNDLATWIGANQATIQPLLQFFATFAIVALGAATAAETLLGVIAIGKGIFTAFGAAITLLSSPFTWIVIAIIAVIAAVALLIMHWDDVKRIAGEVWDWIVKKWSEAGEWFRVNVTEPVAAWFALAWTNISNAASAAWQWVVDTWTGAATWYRTNVTDPIVNWFKKAWEDIKAFFSGAWTAISTGGWAGASTWFNLNVAAPIAAWFKQAWEDIKGFFSDAWKVISTGWGVVSDWFKTNVTDPIEKAFGTALNNIKTNFETIFNGLKTFLKGIINGMIDLVNGMIGAIVSGLNSVIGAINSIKIDIPEWVPGLGGQTWGMNLGRVGWTPIPHLATGAVIPPNAQFAAILGDQRNGRNIETPEALMRQIVQEELSNAGGREVTIRFDGTMAALIRAMRPYIAKEDARVGVSLITLKGTS